MELIIAILAVCLLLGIKEIELDGLHQKRLRTLILTMQEARQFRLHRRTSPADAPWHVGRWKFNEDANTLHVLCIVYSNGTPIFRNHIIDADPEKRFYFVNKEYNNTECYGTWTRNNGSCVDNSISEGAESKGIHVPRTACPACGGDIRQMGHLHFCLACDWDDLERKF